MRQELNSQSSLAGTEYLNGVEEWHCYEFYCHKTGENRTAVRFTLPGTNLKFTPVSILECSLKGKQALIIEPFSFELMELPPEIRLMIFRELLIHEFKIVVGFDREKEHLMNSARRVGRSRYLEYRNRRLHGFNLLLVSKIVRQEAAELAYGENAFEIRGSQAAEAWIDAIGEMSHFLKHVSLVDVNPKRYTRRTLVNEYITRPCHIKTVNLSCLRISHGQLGPLVRFIDNDDGEDFAKKVAHYFANGLAGHRCNNPAKSDMALMAFAQDLIKITPDKRAICSTCRIILKHCYEPAAMLKGTVRKCRRKIESCQEHYDRCRLIEEAISLELQKITKLQLEHELSQKMK